MSLDYYASQKVLSENAAVYDDYYRLGIIDAWEEQDKRYNFSHLFKIADKAKEPLKGASVLDVGCGSGDIIPFLRKQRIKKYVGVDIYKPALKIARKKYPPETFLLMDILKEKSLGRFDFVLASGALSVRLKTLDNYDFLEAMIRKMWHMTTYGLAFNMLTDEDVAPARHLFYYNIAKVKKMCKKIAPHAKIRIKRTPIDNGEGYESEAQIHVYMTTISTSLS